MNCSSSVINIKMIRVHARVSAAIWYLCFLQEEAGKTVLAEFNLGCDVEHTQHVYRVYVTTFLGFGGNMARQRYEDQLVNKTLSKNRYRPAQSHTHAVYFCSEDCVLVAFCYKAHCIFSVRSNQVVHDVKYKLYELVGSDSLLFMVIMLISLDSFGC